MDGLTVTVPSAKKANVAPFIPISSVEVIFQVVPANVERSAGVPLSSLSEQEAKPVHRTTANKAIPINLSVFIVLFFVLLNTQK